MKQRKEPEIRREQILAAALLVAERTNFSTMTREEIARAAGVAPTLVTHYFGTMTQLRRDVMRAAVRGGRLAVIAQGLMARDPHAMKAPDEVKAAARATVGG